MLSSPQMTVLGIIKIIVPLPVPTVLVLKHYGVHTFVVGDRPLVVQFAARNGKEFADAAELVAPFADAVDLNCGCPQR